MTIEAQLKLWRTFESTSVRPLFVNYPIPINRQQLLTSFGISVSLSPSPGSAGNSSLPGMIQQHNLTCILFPNESHTPHPPHRCQMLRLDLPTFVVHGNDAANMKWDELERVRTADISIIISFLKSNAEQIIPFSSRAKEGHYVWKNRQEICW